MDKPTAFNYEDYLRLKAENEAMRSEMEEAKSALEILTEETIRLRADRDAAANDSVWRNAKHELPVSSEYVLCYIRYDDHGSYSFVISPAYQNSGVWCVERNPHVFGIPEVLFWLPLPPDYFKYDYVMEDDDDSEDEPCASCSLDDLWEQIEKKNGGN